MISSITTGCSTKNFHIRLKKSSNALSQIIKRTFRFLKPIRFGVFILISFILYLWSCNIKEEGCLDIAAENFDLSADKNCDGCCTYPSVVVSLSQKWNDVNFKPDSVTYSDMQGDQYRIIDLRYLLSSFSWLDENNAIYTVDSSDIECGGDLLGYTQDLIIVEPRKFVYTLDTIRLSPSVRNLNFKIGWKPEFVCVDETDETLPAVFSDASTL